MSILGWLLTGGSALAIVAAWWQIAKRIEPEPWNSWDPRPKPLNHED